MIMNEASRKCRKTWDETNNINNKKGTHLKNDEMGKAGFNILNLKEVYF